MRVIAPQATPSGTRMMWNASVNAICERAHGTGFTASTVSAFSIAGPRYSSSPSASRNGRGIRRLERLGDLLVVTIVLVGVIAAELGDGAVERVAGAQVRGDRDAITRSGMAPRQGPSAHLGVDPQDRR